MNMLRVDSESSAGGDLLTSTIAIGEREVRQALALHAVERIIAHADVRFTLHRRDNTNNNSNAAASVDDDDNDNQQSTNNSNNVSVFTVSSQSELAKQFLDGFGGVAAFLRWPVPRELLLSQRASNDNDDDDEN
jgi:peptide subunit release factor 1 (eRF1)